MICISEISLSVSYTHLDVYKRQIQALVTKTGFGTPRRAASGFDFNRMNLLLAVLEKRAGYFLGNLDVYINIVGGLELDETACDLSVCLAVVSSLMDKPVPDLSLIHI